MNLNPISIATMGYAPLAALAIASFGYIAGDDVFYASGGIVLSGAADFTVVTTITPAGGLVLGGSAIFEYVPPGGTGENYRRWYRLGVGF